MRKKSYLEIYGCEQELHPYKNMMTVKELMDKLKEVMSVYVVVIISVHDEGTLFKVDKKEIEEAFSLHPYDYKVIAEIDNDQDLIIG